MWFNFLAICAFAALAVCALSDRLQGMIALLLYRLSQLALLGALALSAATFFRPDLSPGWWASWRSWLAAALPLSTLSDREATLLISGAAAVAGLVLIMLTRFIRDVTQVGAELSSIRRLSGRLFQSTERVPVGPRSKDTAELLKEFFRAKR